MSFTNVFGGTTIYPSDVSYLPLALSASTTLQWPLESDGGTPAARIIDVTATGAFNIDLPDATLTGAGQTLLFNNLGASASVFYVRDYGGSVLATVAVGEQWQLYLAATTTAAGTWRVFRYGASTASVQPSALAGYGLTVTAGTLSQSQPVTTFTATPRTVLLTDRATAFVWDGTGTGTINLPSVTSAGNNFFFSAHNSGGGDLTIDPAGSETINGTTTLALRPGDSATLITDGLAWYSLGLGQQAVFAFDYTSIDLTGETSPYTLAGAELNRIAYKFIGTLTANMQVVVPATVQQYWVDNQTTGAYTLTVKTAAGAGASVTQGGRGIYYCDGTNVVNASTAGISVPLLPAEGGTGQTTYTTGDLLYASGTTTLARLADVATGNALISGGVGVAPSWGKVGLTTHISGVLPVANGGTGATTDSGARTALGLGTMATQAASAVAITGGTIAGITDLAVADGGTGASDAGTARTNLGATTVGANVFTLTDPSAITFPRFNADNTVSALDAASFRTAIGAGTGTGTVTSVAASGGTTGLTFTGSPITTAGTLTLGGTLAVANGGTGATTDSGARTALGLGTIATQAASAVSITGGTITGITDLAVADGGTGASDAGTARTNLGAAASGAATASGLTMATSRILGRTTAAAGAIEEISVGSGLSLTAGTLTATGSGGTVTSVGGTGTVNGITLTGTVTTSGNLTLGGTLSGVSLTTQVSGTLPIANGGTGATTDSGARTALGLGTIATQSAASVSITGGSITGITDLAIADGGTGASTAANARTNLGLGTIATQAASAVSITGGTITGITDLAVADGGTGASTAANARVNLLPAYAGNASRVLALNAGATDTEWIAAGGTGTVTSVAASGGTTGLSFTGSPITTSGTLTLTGTLAVANGGTGATTDSGARTALGLGTIATQAASAVNITGGTITGITDLALADGGTGASTAAAARTNLGATTVGANVFTLANPSAITFPRFNADNTVSALDAATFRAAIGAGTGNGSVTSVTASGGTTGMNFTGSPITSSGTLTLTGTLAVANGGTGAGDAGAARTNLGLGSLATLSSVNNDNWSGTDLAVVNGGTGASDASSARANIGAAASGANTDITALDQDVTITATGTIAADSIGYRGLPQNSRTSAYTLALSDAGKHISITTGGVVIPPNAGGGAVLFPVGTTIVIFNNSGSTQTISITTDTLRQAGTANTGTRTLAQYGLATCVKVASTTWVVSGNVS